ncbi:MAG: methylmalonyl Co-A mutase-associated GTPase MeaB [bacterium]
MKKKELVEMVRRMRGGDERALSRLMTLVETAPETIPPIMAGVYGSRNIALKVGVAGPPGSGKSTLIANLVRRAAAAGKRTGVICVDPTSPLSGGAILGDRVRMSTPEFPPGTFIRSVASGGSLGGVSAATRFHAILLEASGADLIIVETVGIGQLGYDVRHVVSTLLLVFVPESGDTIQTLKSGIIELADVIVVNKADRDGAQEIAETLRNNVPDAKNGWRIPVIVTSAVRGEGTERLWAAIEDHSKHMGSAAPHAECDDNACDFRNALAAHFARELNQDFIEKSPALNHYLQKIKDGKLDPFTASKLVFDELFGKNET